jgi:ubiquinone/menaquinone biosynthesis C-methylase UbiE
MNNQPQMPRQPEPELMDDPSEAREYAAADFAAVNQAFANRLLELASRMGDPPMISRVAAVSAARRAGVSPATPTTMPFSVLDLGTGPADIPIRVARARLGWQVTAVDAAPAMLELAGKAIHAAARLISPKSDLQDRIHLLLADAKKLPLADAAFDIIFSNSILHHVADAATFWREVGRLARPGALIFLRDLARPPTVDQARHIVQQHAGAESAVLQQEYLRSLMAAYTVPEVISQLASANLSGLEVRMITDRHFDVWGCLGCHASANPAV